MADVNSMKNAKSIIRAYAKGGASAVKSHKEKKGISRDTHEIHNISTARAFVKASEAKKATMSKGYSTPKKKTKVAKKKVAKKVAKKVSKKVTKKVTKKASKKTGRSGRNRVAA